MDRTTSVPNPMAPRISDRQQTAILRAANPLEGYQRDAFLAALSLLLKDRDDIGDGELFRILRELQKEHFDFPVLNANSRGARER